MKSFMVSLVKSTGRKHDYISRSNRKPLNVGRYHSWVVEEPIPDCLEILAYDENKQIMALIFSLL